jgi:hypothetical protein
VKKTRASMQSHFGILGVENSYLRKWIVTNIFFKDHILVGSGEKKPTSS